eukprot:TRINITY_DN1154_c0_g1_i1.p1 TRINITY_DN1154_c0_g1~~TRINITY_DN1154_c0_g1_i1.p1  ORF type:complete len:142 (-),score=36.41 TRINITY_DN1154_c0_g1_i1:392-817(-)
MHSSNVTIIDYEYSMYMERSYDLGNHFIEWMVENECEEYPGFEFCIDKAPTKEQKRAMAEIYLQEWSLKAPTKQEIKTLVWEADVLSLASLVVWALWALIHLTDSTLERRDWGYGEYALQRYRYYYILKDQLFPQEALVIN